MKNINLFYLLAPFISLSMMFLIAVIENLYVGRSVLEPDPNTAPILEVTICLVAPILLLLMGIFQVPFLVMLENFKQQTLKKVIVFGTIFGLIVNVLPSNLLYSPETEEFWSIYLFFVVIFAVPFVIGVIGAWYMAWRQFSRKPV